MNESPSDPLCIGILYCGDLGAALGHALKKTGARVITTCEGRSLRTRERAADAGVHILATLDELIREADVLVSLVMPDAALDIAQQCANRKDLAKPGCLFVDANSIDLSTLFSVQDAFAGTAIRFVDAAIHGGAAKLETMGVMYISGSDAAEAAERFAPVMRVLSLGDEIGQATRMKLLMAGQSKCLNLLFLQVAVLACKAGMLDVFLNESKTFYPEIMVAIERMLPTYPRHAARRVIELESIEDFARSVDAPHQMVHSARDFLQAVASEWNSRSTPPRDISTIVELAASPPSPKESEHEL